jgi:hypothetical protein
MASAWLLAAVAGLKLPSMDDNEAQRAVAHDRTVHFAAVGLALVLLTLALIPATPAARAYRLDGVSRSGVCNDKEVEVVARLGHESIQLSFGDQALPLADEKLAMPVGRLELDPVARQAWWSASLEPQPSGTTMLYLVQRTSDSLGSLVPAFTRQPIPASGPLTSFCLVQDGGVKLGDFQFWRVVDWHSRDGSTR